MKHAFTSNKHTYRVCIPAIEQTKVQSERVEDVSALEESSPRHCDFEDLLLEAVDDELSSLGESVKQSVYHNLKKTFKIDRRTIPHKIDQFATAIEKMFGDGAKLVEIQIMKRLYQKVHHKVEYSSESADLVFTKYMKAIDLSERH